MAKLLTDLLREAAALSPEAPAVRLNGREWSYGELDDASDRLAGILRRNGARTGDRVGILASKSFESVAGIYGALKAGAAYVPLDYTAPAARIASIIRDCGIRQVVTNEAGAACLRQVLETAPHRFDLMIGPLEGAMGWHAIDRAPREKLPTNFGSNPLAYILYTSGSTGAPKGIMHTHASALAFVEWAADALRPSSEDRFSSHAPFHFDLSILDLFVSAAAGAAVVLIPEAVAKLPASLTQLIERERLSIWYSVPYALIQILERGSARKRDLRSLRWVLFAGEQMAVSYLERLLDLLPDAQFANLYGPTETNVCTWYPVSGKDDCADRIPIGRVCSGDEALVVNAGGEAVTPGNEGELLIRGGSVMAGYWNSTFAGSAAAGAIQGLRRDEYYRTGDLVREREDGNYLFFGRRDRQVKIRGYRIELDEIERALASHPDVEEAAVFLTDDDGQIEIEAAAVAKAGRTITSGGLVAHIAAQTPPYAVPGLVTVRAFFPRTSTGKLDRRALIQETLAAVVRAGAD
jgi:amino acid adenylation domain-containing protein